MSCRVRRLVYQDTFVKPEAVVGSGVLRQLMVIAEASFVAGIKKVALNEWYI
jgi:hypothetical protein